MLWEHPNGYFLAALSSCRKADLQQLCEWVGVARSLSPGLGPCWPWGRKVPSLGDSVQWLWLERCEGDAVWRG